MRACLAMMQKHGTSKISSIERSRSKMSTSSKCYCEYHSPFETWAISHRLQLRSSGLGKVVWPFKRPKGWHPNDNKMLGETKLSV